MSSKATFTGKNLKSLVAAVTKFPSIGSFAGSELVNLSVGNGVATATSMGVVLARARVAAEGDLPLVAIDERFLSAAALSCPDDRKAVIEEDGKEIRILHRRENATGFRPGVAHSIPNKAALESYRQLQVDAQMAERLSYLGNIAFADSSRPELNCVMLAANGTAMACNQKAIAVLVFASSHKVNVALPIPLAKALSKDSLIYAGEKETVIKEKSAIYVMPTPVVAASSFPVDAIQGYAKLKSTPVLDCSGERLAAVVIDCDAIMASVVKSEVAIKLVPGNGIVELSAVNGVVRFQAKLKANIVGTGELLIPLEELSSLLPFVAKQPKVTISLGKNRETFMAFGGSDWAMFASWKK